MSILLDDGDVRYPKKIRVFGGYLYLQGYGFNFVLACMHKYI